ncbi:MAG: helix-turn-helix domain-containing protein [Armatimonadetes bacterium]|nr:helix-turn-helix domain-containing protein [Armatimonadota bacterium]
MKTLSKTRLEYKKEEEEGKALRDEMLTTGENPLLLWRKRHNLSRVDLAVLAGISVGTVEKLEVGYPKTISQKLLLTLHDKAGVPYELAASYILWRNSLAEKAREKATGRG